ncbi:hypothetical protein [Actinomadura sp. 6N118]|uniref:hypothetical protein n=1 Tax=Actinomadura sp. 6N118 TaxID=3375151 RepID=UPI0037A6C958
MKVKNLRGLPAMAALVSVAACSGIGSPAAGTRQTTPARGPATASALPELPRVRPYVIAADEPAPEVKRAAVRFIEVLTNYDDGGGLAVATRKRLAAAGLSPALAGQAGVLLTPSGAGAGEVVYPQLGGLTRSSASIMAVVRLTTRQGANISTSIRTIDVRLARSAAGWVVARIASTGGLRLGDGRAPSPLAARVLANDRIVLPDTARWDIQAGRLDARVLRLMLGIAAKHTISVTVLSTGHPFQVYGSESVSNHKRGRAVDIWAVDGRRVAEQRRGTGAPARLIAVQALANGATEVGAPWVVSSSRGTSFTNTVHQDHLHLGFKR